MERRAEDIFRVHDLSVLKSPLPAHLTTLSPGIIGSKGPSSNSVAAATPTQPSRPKPIIGTSPFGLSALTSTLQQNLPPVPLGNPFGVPSPFQFATPQRPKNSSTTIETPAKLEETRKGEEVISNREDIAVARGNTDEALRKLVDDLNVGETVNVVAANSSNTSNSESLPAVSFLPSERLTRTFADRFLGTKNSERPQETKVEHQAKAEEVPEELADRPAAELPQEKLGQPTSEKMGVVLRDWSLAMVPNNANISKVEKNQSEDWIVLVGKRPDMVEMWHSSLVSGRTSNRELSTGSGRIYRLEGPMDRSTVLDHGFSAELVEKFADGFPEDWRVILIGEFQRIRQQMPAETENSWPRSINLRNDGGSNGGHGRKKSIRNNRRPPKTATPTEANDDKTPKRSRAPSQSETPEPAVFSVGRTRSGRIVVKPLPYWENKYINAIGSDTQEKPSPTNNLVKRRWGNRIEL